MIDIDLGRCRMKSDFGGVLIYSCSTGGKNMTVYIIFKDENLLAASASLSSSTFSVG